MTAGSAYVSKAESFLISRTLKQADQRNKHTTMEMLIIGSGCLLGYILNKDGSKQSRAQTADVHISPNRLPNGPLIYDSNRVAEVKSIEQDLAAGKFQEKIKQTFPDTYAQPVSVFPGDDYATAGYPAPLAALADTSSGVSQYANNVKQAMTSNTNTGAYDPSTGHALFPSTAETIDSSPMFRAFEFKGPMVEDGSTPTSGPLSLLSGQPLDMNHNNMQPMFGANVYQSSAEDANSQVRLERFTGLPSTDDQGTYRNKVEVMNPLPNNPDSLSRANISQVADIYERAQTSVKPSHEYITPVQAVRDAPMQADAIRILPYDIDQTRGALNKQVTYEGVMIPGQKGSTRGMLPNARDNPWDLSKMTSIKDFAPNRAVGNGKNLTLTPTVRNVLATTQDREMNYFTAPNHQRKLGDYSGRLSSQQATTDATVTRRMEAFSPGFGTARRATNVGPNVGTLMVKDTEGETAIKYTGQPFKNVGMTSRNVTAPGYTLKDASAENTVGAVNASGLKSNTSYRSQKLNAPVTTKDLNGKNRYRGQPHKNLGMGFVKQGIQKWTTNKETNQFSQRGNPMSSVTGHMSYDALFEDTMDKTVAGDRYGVAKGRTAKEVVTGEVNNNAGPSLEVEDYVGIPSASIPAGQDRKALADSWEGDGGRRVDFGGHVNGGKHAIGPAGARKSAMRIGQDTTVMGRMNVPMRHDNPNLDGISVEAQLKTDAEVAASRPMVQRTQPLQVVTDRMPVVVKTRNVEALNPRLDTGTRITSDLYPWIKER